MMQRQIKFRGKAKPGYNYSKNGDGWIYGSLIDLCDGDCGIVQQSDITYTCSGIHDYCHVPVVPETVGQYTGFMGFKSDERQNDICELYEGDIVEAWSSGSKGVFAIKWRPTSHPGWILYPAWQNGVIYSIAPLLQKDGSYYDDLIKIGNIYDNPELMK